MSLALTSGFFESQSFMTWQNLFAPANQFLDMPTDRVCNPKWEECPTKKILRSE